MEFKIVITATREQDPLNTVGREYVFKDAAVITLGRGGSNDIPFTDTDRTVSRRHARIVAVSGGIALEDLDSKNFTFLNGKRIDAGEPRLLQNGDMIRIGDFKMEVYFTASLRDTKATIVDSSLLEPDYAKNNPFIAVVDEVFQGLARMCELFDEQDIDSPADYLSYAIEKAMPAQKRHKALGIFVSSFNDTEVSTLNKLPPGDSAS